MRKSNFYTPRYIRGYNTITNRKVNPINIILIAIGFIFLFPLYRYVRTQIEKNKRSDEIQLSKTNSSNNSLSTPIELKRKAESLALKFPFLSKEKLDKIINSAFNLSYALGTNASSYRPYLGIDWMPDKVDVGAWDENEKEAILIIKKYPGTFPILADYYQKIATKNRDLKADIRRYLSVNDIKNINKTWAKYGSYKLTI